MNTSKIYPIYQTNIKQDGNELHGSEWTSLSEAAHVAQEKINSLIDDIDNIPGGGGSFPLNEIVLKGSLSFASQVTRESTIYVIQDNFDLGNDTITIPNNCVLRFEKGVIRNGSIVLSNTRLEGEVKFNSTTISGSCSNDILTPQMFGAIGSITEDISTVSSDTMGFQNLANVINNNNTRSKIVYIPSGHYALNRKINFIKSCTVYGDGDTTVIDCYDGAGGITFGYKNNNTYGGCRQLINTITQDLSVGDSEVIFNSASGINVGDYLIISDTQDYSFNKSRAYFRTSEAVKVASIEGNIITLLNTLNGNYYSASGRTVISKFEPESFIVKDLHIISHETENTPETYYTFSAYCIADSLFENVTVDNYGNHTAGAIILGLNFKVDRCTFRNFIDDDSIYDVYGLAVQSSQDFIITDSTFRGGEGVGGHCHGLATGCNDSVFAINNRRFVYQRLHFEASVIGTIDLDVHGGSEHYKYVDIYAPNVVCDTGGYDVTIEGCQFYKVSNTFNCDGIRLINSEIMHSQNILWSSDQAIDSRAKGNFVIIGCRIHGPYWINLQRTGADTPILTNFIFKDNICDTVRLDHGYVSNLVVDGNVFNDGGSLISYDMNFDHVSVIDNTFVNGCVALTGQNVRFTINMRNNIITQTAASTYISDDYTIMLQNCDGMFANNVINRNFAGVRQTVLIGKQAKVNMENNVFTITDKSKPVVLCANDSNVLFTNNTHNSPLVKPVYVQTGGKAVYDRYEVYSDANNHDDMKMLSAIGTPFYMGNANRIGCVSTALKGASLLYDRASSSTPYIGDNIFTKGEAYAVFSHSSAEMTLYFSKSNVVTDANKDSVLLKAVDFTTNPRPFIAQNPEEYPYIYVINGRDQEVPFEIHLNRMASDYDGSIANVIRFGNTAHRPEGNDVPDGFVYYDTDLQKPIFRYLRSITNNISYWRESDGTKVGTRRLGTTAQRPNGDSIHVGFVYFDTDLQKLIFAGAIEGNSVTWLIPVGTDTAPQEVQVNGFTISGNSTITATGNYNYTLTNVTPNDATVGIQSIQVYAGNLNVSNATTNGFTVAVDSLSGTQQITLIVVATLTNGNTVTETKDITLEAPAPAPVPVTGFEVSGPSTISSTGDYSYTITNIVPANANVEISSVAVNAGSIQTSNVSTSGFTLNVSDVGTGTNVVTVTVTATLQNGNTVIETKDITIEGVVVPVPVTGFTISGSDLIDNTGKKVYTITDVTPANANVGISSITATAGDYNVQATGTSSFSFIVDTLDGTELLPISVTATLEDGTDVVETKTVKLRQPAPAVNFVDLGLASGTLWAEANIGAANEEDSGYYFTYGNVDGYTVTNEHEFTLADYNTTPGRQQGFTIDVPQDAARVYYGEQYLIPTSADYVELIDGCTWRQDTVNGVNGWEGTSKANNNTIFFPRAGLIDATGERQQYGSGGYYFTSNSEDKAGNNNAFRVLIDNAGMRQPSFAPKFSAATLRAIKRCTPVAVDLGLPSGKLWADRNVGAISATDGGQYFSWGNIIGHYADSHKNGSDPENYDNTPGATLTASIAANDSAHNAPIAVCGGSWRMPTISELQELINSTYTTTEWTTVDSVTGLRITSKSNGNSIFLPASGMMANHGPGNEGTAGSYASSNLHNNGISQYELYFTENTIDAQATSGRFVCISIRPIQDAIAANSGDAL